MIQCILTGLAAIMQADMCILDAINALSNAARSFRPRHSLNSFHVFSSRYNVILNDGIVRPMCHRLETTSKSLSFMA